jgi:hypothetical protein
MELYALLDPLSELIYNDYLLGDGEYFNAKRMFDNISGRFLANILTAGAIGNSAMLHTKIKPAQSENEFEGILQSVWVQGDIQHFRYYGEENNDTDIKSLGGGLQAGFPIWRGRHNLGLFLGYDYKNLFQAADKAYMSDIQLGLYGGLFNLGEQKNINIKGNISGGIQYFDTERKLELSGFEDNPLGAFKTYSIRYAAEGEFILIESRDKERVFKPFIGLHGGLSFNSEIVEFAGQGADLVVEEGVYSRLNGLLGFRIEDLTGDVNWNLKAYLAYLFMGYKPQYDMHLEQIPDIKMDIWGTPIEQLNGGVGFWLNYKITQSLSFFTNFDLTFANRMFGYYINGGINYRIFGNLSEIKSREEAIKERKTREEQLREAQIREEREAYRSVRESARAARKVRLDLREEDYALEPGRESDFSIEIPTDLEVELAAQKQIEDAASGKAKSEREKYAVNEKSFRMRIAVYNPDLKVYELDDELKFYLDGVIDDIKKYKYTRVTLLSNGGNQAGGQDLAAIRMDVIYEYFYINGIDIDKLDAVDVGKFDFEGVEKNSVERNTVEIVVDYLDF